MQPSIRRKRKQPGIVSHYFKILQSLSRGLGYYSFIKGHRTFGAAVSSTRPLDVVIPIAERDVPVAPFAIDSVREHLRHPLGKIVLIGSPSVAIRRVCSDKACEFVDENAVFPLVRTDIRYCVNGVDRSGWLFQQLLKWAAASLVEQEHYLVLDADTVLLAPQVFEQSGKTVLLHSGQYHRPYLDAYIRLLCETPRTALSFVSHMMVLEKAHLRELEQTLERLHNPRVWYLAILNAIDYRERSAFSEYETYGQWMLAHHPGEITREFTFHLRARKAWRQLLPQLQTQYRNRYRSVSLHAWAE